MMGIGDAGNRIVNRIALTSSSTVAIAQVNSSLRALNGLVIGEKLQLGKNSLRGLGSGGDATAIRSLILSERETIRPFVEGVDLLFLIAGLGGGNGSGAIPPIAQIAEACGCVVIAFVTLPFGFEGKHRQTLARESLSLLRQHCHAVIPLNNEHILQRMGSQVSALDAFIDVDKWVVAALEAFKSMLLKPGLMEVDFAQLKKSLCFRGGRTLYGYGEGKTAPEAVQTLLHSPLRYLPEFAQKADALIVHIEIPQDLSLNDIHSLMDLLTKEFSSKMNTLLGAVVNKNEASRVKLFVLGTTDVNSSLNGNQLTLVGETAANLKKKKHKKQGRKKIPQEADPVTKKGPMEGQREFLFARSAEDRGFFSTTGINLYEGEDLDIPTFLRRGIKINLETPTSKED